MVLTWKERGEENWPNIWKNNSVSEWEVTSTKDKVDSALYSERVNNIISDFDIMWKDSNITYDAILNKLMPEVEKFSIEEVKQVLRYALSNNSDLVPDMFDYYRDYTWNLNSIIDSDEFLDIVLESWNLNLIVVNISFLDDSEINILEKLISFDFDLLINTLRQDSFEETSEEISKILTKRIAEELVSRWDLETAYDFLWYQLDKSTDFYIK